MAARDFQAIASTIHGWPPGETGGDFVAQPGFGESQVASLPGGGPSGSFSGSQAGCLCHLSGGVTQASLPVLVLDRGLRGRAPCCLGWPNHSPTPNACQPSGWGGRWRAGWRWHIRRGSEGPRPIEAADRGFRPRRPPHPNLKVGAPSSRGPAPVQVPCSPRGRRRRLEGLSKVLHTSWRALEQSLSVSLSGLDPRNPCPDPQKRFRRSLRRRRLGRLNACLSRYFISTVLPPIAFLTWIRCGKRSAKSGMWETTPIMRSLAARRSMP